MKAREIAHLGVLLSVAILAGYVERIVPSPVPLVPGIKLGLANAVVLIILYNKDAKTALFINILRILIVGLLFTGVTGVIYGLAGGLFSFAMMYAAKKSHVFGLVGVSVLGAVCHNLGQIIVASFVVANIHMLYYFPVLLISGVITGALVGFLAFHCIIRLSHLPTN